MLEGNVRIDMDGNIAVVTIHRPEKLNALNSATLGDLQHAFDALRADDAVRAVIVTGAGEKAFVAGADIRELVGLGALTGKETARRGSALFRDIELFPRPVIAAVNGFALGGGCELALACHLRIAADTARFGLPEVSLGVIPGYGGTQRLARLVGRGRALELVLTGRPIDAPEAYRIGLANRVVAAAQLLEECKNLSRQILANGPVAVMAALEVIQRGIDLPLAEGLLLETNAFGVVCASQDKNEGMQAFLDKRKPQFHNR